MSSGGLRSRASDADFMRLFEKEGASKTARILGVTERGVYKRREALEQRHRRQIVSPERSLRVTRVGIAHPQRAPIEIENGIVLVGSDAHYWPGEPSTAHRAFVWACKEFKPKAVILNGDVIDAASISRHAPLGWENQPTVQDEIEAAQERLGEIEAATFKCQKIWTLGNHDGRYETRLATIAPEYCRVHGFHLKDFFPHWTPAWSAWINADSEHPVVAKHRFKSGIHAPHNNTMWAGCSMITGHLHSAKVYPLTDYIGTRYGVDTGCLADPEHRAFNYLEDAPRNWRSAFTVLTFHKGRLLMPELVLVWDKDHIEFRGRLIKV